MSKAERFAEVISVLLLFMLLAGTAAAYIRLPEMIPTRLNAMDAPDGYEQKYTLLVYPVLGLVIYLAMSLINFFLIKQQDYEQEYREPQHARTVWLLRMGKVLIMAGLVLSVVEIVKVVYYDKDMVKDAIFIFEALFTVMILGFVIRHVSNRLLKRRS